MGNGPEKFTFWHGLFLAEGAALMIALVMPIAPSKTGSDRGLADYFISNPSYLQEVVFNFILTNILLLIIAFIVWLWVKLR